MKNAEAESQQQQNAGHVSASVSSPSASTSTLAAAPKTASAEGLQLLVQARLSVSSPNDPFEHEAESMADEFVKSMHGRTVSAPTSSVGSVARSVPDSGLVEGGGGLATTDDTASAIMSARAGGQGLSGDVRARFEGFFGADLGGVKIHNDGTSDNLCRSINAEAFTTGTDVFFSSRSFKPGSSSGDHLLAHELTHVVQQGNAPALSRRALPDIQRAWYNPFSWGKDDEPEKDDEPQGPGPTEDTANQKAGNVAAGLDVTKAVPAIVAGAKADSAVSNPSLQNQVTKDSATTGGALGLVAATTALFTTIVRLVSDWDKETTNSARDQLIAAVKSAVTICQNSTSIAATAGASVAAGAIPGIGLAYNVIDLGLQSVKIHETKNARSSADERIAEIKKTDAATRTFADKKLLVSLENLSASAESEYIRSIFRLTSTLISISGQITVLATAATGAGAVVGGALIAVGAVGQGVVALQGKIAQWSAAGGIAASREDLERAKIELQMHLDASQGVPTEEHADKTKELSDRVDDLTVNNLGVDAYAAAADLIQYSAGLVKTDGEFDPEAISLVGQFSISEAWLKSFVKGGSTPEMLDKGAKLICEFIGKSPEAKGLVADLKTAASYVASGIQWVASSGYWVLKFASKIVLSVAITPVALLVGLFGELIGKPQLGYQFIDAYADIAQKIGDGIENGAAGLYNAAAKKISGDQPNYFANSLDVQTRTSYDVLPIIESYFKAKADRGTDVKPESVTDKLKGPYKGFIAASKVAPPNGDKPFASSTEQMMIVDKTVTVLIKEFAPERVNKDSIKVVMGKVDFKYVGSEKAKTKGWFADWRGREAVKD